MHARLLAAAFSVALLSPVHAATALDLPPEELAMAELGGAIRIAPLMACLRADITSSERQRQLAGAKSLDAVRGVLTATTVPACVREFVLLQAELGVLQERMGPAMSGAYGLAYRNRLALEVADVWAHSILQTRAAPR